MDVGEQVKKVEKIGDVFVFDSKEAERLNPSFKKGFLERDKKEYRFSFGAYPAACCDKLNSLNNSVI